MRAADIIRDLLDIIERIDGEESPAAVAQQPASATAAVATGVDQNRFKQILDLLTVQPKLYDNSPAEVVASIDSVTIHAGQQGVHPSDIRADSAAMYPGFQARSGD